MSESLELKDVRVSLGGATILLGVDMALASGAYGVVLGASGAGKSTLLRAIAGLVPAEGQILIGERSVCAGEQVVAPEQRGVGFQFQGLALWPHMTVDRHLRYALKVRRLPAAEATDRINETLEPLGLLQLADRRPGELSGGEQQRLALARALVMRPAVLLLDEPTSSVDPRTADEVRDVLADLNSRFGTTVLHVTHDQDEALGLADRVFVMEQGKILQGGTPAEIYDRPASAAVGTFVGAGGLLAGTLTGDGSADTPLGAIPVEGDGLEGPVWILVRPEHLEVVSDREGVPAAVERVVYGGGSFRLRLRVGDGVFVADVGEKPAGDEVRIKVRGRPRAVERRRHS